MAIRNANPRETTDRLRGQDLNTLLELLLNIDGQDTEEDVQFNSPSLSQAPPQQISSRHVNEISQTPIISSDPISFGLVDSLTFVHCKRLSLVIDEEKMDDEFEVIDYHWVEPERLIEQRNRTGIRRGQQFATFAVPTKK
ncbi:hypothetical protein ACHAW6_014642 [Cyclotella cf. meneghiniana]